MTSIDRNGITRIDQGHQSIEAKDVEPVISGVPRRLDRELLSSELSQKQVADFDL